MTEKKAAAVAASAVTLDFTNVSERSADFVNPKRVPAGDYRARITGVFDAPSKKDGNPQWKFVIELVGRTGYTYPYYCKLVENQLWKLRALCVAAGLQVPKKRIKVDPNKLVGKLIGITLEDDDYNDKERSKIEAIFPASEVEGSPGDDDIDDEDEDEEDNSIPAEDEDEDEVSDDDLDELDIDDV